MNETHHNNLLKYYFCTIVVMDLKMYQHSLGIPSLVIAITRV